MKIANDANNDLQVSTFFPYLMLTSVCWSLIILNV